MSVPRFPRSLLDPQPRTATIQDLNLGQVVTLLKLRGGEAALLMANALLEDAPPDFARQRPEDTCTLAILEAAYVTRDGAKLTGKGMAWSQQILDGE